MHGGWDRAGTFQTAGDRKRVSAAMKLLNTGTPIDSDELLAGSVTVDDMTGLLVLYLEVSFCRLIFR